MRILFEITHPKHAHLFRNAIFELTQRGNTIAITAREKDVTTCLLDSWNLEYTLLSSGKGRGIIVLGLELLKRDWRLWRFTRNFRPDIIVARVGPSAAHVGFLIKRPVLVFEDTEDGVLQQRITFPFVTRVCTATHYEKDWGKKHIRYQSFDELAYLHPKRFIPDESIPREYGLEPGSYIIARFVSWQAAHDIWQSGIKTDHKLKTLLALEKHARVLVVSESPMPDEFKRFQLPFAPNQFHHLLAFSKLTFGESSTVAVEGAILGIPGVLVNSMNWGAVNRLVKHYKMLYQTRSEEEALRIAMDLLLDPNTPSTWRLRREKLLCQEADLTDWMIEQIEFWGRKSADSLDSQELSD